MPYIGLPTPDKPSSEIDAQIEEILEAFGTWLRSAHFVSPKKPESDEFDEHIKKCDDKDLRTNVVPLLLKLDVYKPVRKMIPGTGTTRDVNI